MPTQKITPFLWFDNNAEEAVRFYLSVFKQGKILQITRYPAGAPGEAGSVMTVDFKLFGQRYTALNGGPGFKFNESVSFVVHCKTQREVDTYWKKLIAGGGEASQCGWLKDKYGLSWQITPEVLLDLITSKDRAKVERVMKVMMTMGKLEIKPLKAAAAKRG